MPTLHWFAWVVIGIILLLAAHGLLDICAMVAEGLVTWHDRHRSNATDRPMVAQWFTLPGQRLELGNTGFWIHFSPDRDLSRQLLLFSPEGRSIACGPEHLLDEMKAHAELRAANRIEFNSISKRPGK